ncbi:MAG: hypothetical protein KC731_04935 [Myxococcales bacterium]|nr:hypothetical protein [Myxococcales bacterium]
MPAPYGLVEATPGFIVDRLDALAKALLLPRPSRDGFLFDASPAFYASCTASVVTLQRATRRIIHHLRIPCETVVVGFTPSLGAAARIEPDGANFFVEIDPRFRDDPHALGAILAHEMCHILAAQKGLRVLGNALDEVHVDLLALLTGLGPLTLNGIVDRRDGDQVLEHRSLGYLRADILEYAMGAVAARLGLAPRAVLASIDNPLVRRGVRAAMRKEGWRLRLGRAKPLTYGPAPSHEIVPCAGPEDGTCEARLRFPAGKLGKARCPTCGTERPFDGRLLEVVESETPTPLEDAVPPRVRFAKLRSRRRLVPASAKLGLAAVLLLPLAGIGLNAAQWLQRAAVGEPCTSDRACRSERCLRITASPQPWRAPATSFGDPELDAQLQDSLDRIADRMDPLSPNRDDGRFVKTVEAYCTDDCTSDDDCPAGLTCGEVRRFAVGPLGDDFIEGRGIVERACVKE